MIDKNVRYSQPLAVLPGRPYPLGSWVQQGGVRFVVFSRHASRIWLALFSSVDDEKPAVEIPFERAHHRTGDIWSIFIPGLESGVLYAYRMDGIFEPAQGHRYNSSVYLLDPHARLVVGDIPAGRGKCVVVDDDDLWLDDKRPQIAMRDTVIYETHVRGLSIDPSASVAHPGTYLGLIEKIPYLKELGVTAVDLLPIQEFGEDHLHRCSLVTGQELRNYWGYNTIAFFAPSGRYASRPAEGSHLSEFREMVSALHNAGIEVIMDVVFNHTAEGNELGPTLSFRGIDNSIYYQLDEDGGYRNYSGCGNTMNCNHPLVRHFILDCLHYWVTAMHIDGFRFDLASILGRDRKGRIVENAPLIETIAEDPLLRDVKLIAEAWDAGGAYQVGSFGDIRWAEWNGRYRDDVRRFWRGDPVKGDFATRITGSSDLYQYEGRNPSHSINFLTAHDGFTLRDLVSYNRKHNEANGENNQDGQDENFSWNCGAEGETNDPGILALRLRMQKNYIATLFLSLGVPMLLGGDEFGRTQRGNNNAYCQDNDISWYNWKLLYENGEIHRFCAEMIRFRRENPVFRRETFFAGAPVEGATRPDIVWFDPAGRQQHWDNAESAIACRIDGSVNHGVSLYLMFNPSNAPVRFRVTDESWRVRIDTSRNAPDDILTTSTADPLRPATHRLLAPKSLVVLTAWNA